MAETPPDDTTAPEEAVVSESTRKSVRIVGTFTHISLAGRKQMYRTRYLYEPNGDQRENDLHQAQIGRDKIRQTTPQWCKYGL